MRWLTGEDDGIGQALVEQDSKYPLQNVIKAWFKLRLFIKSLKNNAYSCTDKKEREKNFLLYKKIQKRAVAKSYMTDGLLIYD